jgi:hypothetical protein
MMALDANQDSTARDDEATEPAGAACWRWIYAVVLVVFVLWVVLLTWFTRAFS